MLARGGEYWIFCCLKKPITHYNQQFALLVMQVQAHEDVTASVAAEPPAALIPPRAAEDPNERRSGLPLIIRRISYATPTNTGNSSIANALNAFLASVPAPIRLLVDHIRTDPQARLCKFLISVHRSNYRIQDKGLRCLSYYL